MTREERAITIVELITHAMAAINDGEQAEQLVCRTVAKAAGADCGTLIGLELGRRLRLHAVWPDQRNAAALADVAARGGHHSNGSGTLHFLTHSTLGEVVTIGPDLEHPANLERGRVLALSRRAGFSPEAHSLFTEAGGPLQLLFPHIAEACSRAQAARSAAEAAAALNLTAREVEVLQLLSEGLLARTIAARLGLSPRTVHKHLSNVYSKLGVHDRLVAVSIARSRGLIAA